MTESPIETDRERLEREFERLEMKRRALDLALGEFLHEGRRTRDALERVGGHSHALEAKARGLKKNAKLTRQDLEKTDREIESLRQRLAEIGTEIDHAEDS
jgi:chromosome segregation ATPase